MKLGDKCIVNNKLVRYCIEPDKREWVPKEITFKAVIIIGVRTLRNGIVLYQYGDEQNLFEVTSTIKAYLVVEDLNKKPFYTTYF